MKNIEELAKEERRAYFREYRARNKEKIKAQNARYWAKRALKRAKDKALKQEETRGEGHD